MNYPYKPPDPVPPIQNEDPPPYYASPLERVALTQCYELLKVHKISPCASPDELEKAAIYHQRQWESKGDIASRNLCACLYNVLGQIERITELGLELPQWAKGKKQALSS